MFFPMLQFSLWSFVQLIAAHVKLNLETKTICFCVFGLLALNLVNLECRASHQKQLYPHWCKQQCVHWAWWSIAEGKTRQCTIYYYIYVVLAVVDHLWTENHLCVFSRPNKAELLRSPASKDNRSARPPFFCHKELKRLTFHPAPYMNQSVSHDISSPCLTIWPSTLVSSSMTDVPLLGSMAPWTQLSLWFP